MKTNRIQGAKAQNNDVIINDGTVYSMAKGIALKAIKTILSRSAGKAEGTQAASGQSVSTGAYSYIDKLYRNTITDIRRIVDIKHIVRDGMDIVHEAVVALMQHIGKRLTDTAYIDKRGKVIDVKRAVFRAVNSYIMRNRTRYFKTVALLDNGQYITLPPLWDINTIYEYKKTLKIIKMLKLSKQERRILGKRYQGLSRNQIAETMGNNPQKARNAVNVYLSRIAKKAEKIGLKPKK
jgi:DNA-binding NarL/FixJ family response regulator